MEKRKKEGQKEEKEKGGVYGEEVHQMIYE